MKDIKSSKVFLKVWRNYKLTNKSHPLLDKVQTSYADMHACISNHSTLSRNYDRDMFE